MLMMYTKMILCMEIVKVFSYFFTCKKLYYIFRDTEILMLLKIYWKNTSWKFA